MSYTIYKANGTPVVVPDNAIDTTFYNANAHSPGVGVGTQLVGRNAINYGAPTAQNFLQMTENFASTLAFRPTDAYALQGQLWFNATSTTTGDLHVRISSATAGGDVNWNKLITADSSGNIPNRGGTTPSINPTAGLEEDGDMQVIGSVISIWANGAWRQTFPAVYS
jgi:hypothetical protein